VSECESECVCIYGKPIYIYTYMENPHNTRGTADQRGDVQTGRHVHQPLAAPQRKLSNLRLWSVAQTKAAAAVVAAGAISTHTCMHACVYEEEDACV
jgi:hypothetical protein